MKKMQRITLHSLTFYVEQNVQNFVPNIFPLFSVVSLGLKLKNLGFMFPSFRRRCSRPAPATYKFSEEGKRWNGVSQEQQVQTAFNVLILEFGGAMAVVWSLLALAHSTLNPNRQEGAHDLTHKQHTTLSYHSPTDCSHLNLTWRYKCCGHYW